MRSRISVITAITVAAMVAGAEGTARLIERRLPAEPGKWPRREMASKYDQMRAMAGDGRAVEVAFVGNSTMVNGIDPVAFTRRTGRPSYNAAFAGASPRTVARWTLDIVEPLLSPEVVVVGVQSRDLNHNGIVQGELLESFLASPGYRQITAGVAHRLEAAVERASAFMRSRREFRSPARLLGRLLRTSGAHPRYGFVGPAGRREGDAAAPYRIHDDWRRRQRLRTLNDYAPGGSELTALRRLGHALQSRGVRVVLLSMPVTADFHRLHPRGDADVLSYRRLLRRFARKAGAPLIEADRVFAGTGPFKDPVHLDGLGRSRFTARVAQLWPGLPSRGILELNDGAVAVLRRGKQASQGRREGAYLKVRARPRTPRSAGFPPAKRGER